MAKTTTMIIKQFRVQNIKTGKIIVMNENSINALKRHHLWNDFDILPEPKPIEQPIVTEFVDTSNIVITNVDESPIEQSEKPKRKNKKS